MNDTAKSAANPWLKLAALLLLLAVIAGGWWFFADRLKLESLATNESQLRSFQQEHPVLVYGIAFALYVAVTGFSLPGALPLSIIYGWYFGLVPGTILVSFASTTGATLAFVMSRYLFRDFVMNRFGERQRAFHDALEREGPFFLFTLRALPLVPFFVINAVMGVTPIRLRTYWWVSQLGMLPGTIVFVYAGSSFPSLQKIARDGVWSAFTPSQSIQIVAAFVAIGLLPLLVRGLIKLLRTGRRDA